MIEQCTVRPFVYLRNQLYKIIAYNWTYVSPHMSATIFCQSLPCLHRKLTLSLHILQSCVEISWAIVSCCVGDSRCRYARHVARLAAGGTDAGIGRVLPLSAGATRLWSDRIGGLADVCFGSLVDVCEIVDGTCWLGVTLAARRFHCPLLGLAAGLVSLELLLVLIASRMLWDKSQK